VLARGAAQVSAHRGGPTYTSCFTAAAKHDIDINALQAEVIELHALVMLVRAAVAVQLTLAAPAEASAGEEALPVSEAYIQKAFSVAVQVPAVPCSATNNITADAKNSKADTSAEALAVTVSAATAAAAANSVTTSSATLATAAQEVQSLLDTLDDNISTGTEAIVAFLRPNLERRLQIQEPALNLDADSW
jgi:hypothetical protein